MEEEVKKIKIYGRSGYYLDENPYRKRTGEIYKCETCTSLFYVSPSYLRKNDSNKTTIRYCCLKCYDKNGVNNPMYGKKMSKESLEKLKNNPNRSKFKSGKDNPNFLKYSEEVNYIGKSISWWKEKLVNTVGKCEKCEYSNKKALQLHHIDKNTKNNVRDNLILLCANCHCIEHYNDRSGIYKFLKYERIKRS